MPPTAAPSVGLHRDGQESQPRGFWLWIIFSMTSSKFKGSHSGKLNLPWVLGSHIPTKETGFPFFHYLQEVPSFNFIYFRDFMGFFFFKPYSQADPSVFLNNILLLIIPNIDLTSCSWNLTLNSRVTAILS